jgi:diaminohydroxyphosphoribosylaminopyrimidine deaminase/5-amino-6-(5-phosphoribosylamino)uracil reductase
VIVHEGRIIGEGWHQKDGGPHAEVRALDAVAPADRALLANATLYVNLEPCAHHGRTPPCADRVVAEGLGRVVVGAVDPDPRVAGKGIQRIQAAGIPVVSGVLEEASVHLTRGYRMRIRQRRPWVMLKWAESADAFMGPVGGQPMMLSNAFSRRLTHRWRAACGAILVGTRTALSDDPSLTVRFASGEHPLRVVLDRSGRIPAQAKLFDGQAPTLRITESALPALKGCDDLALPFDENLLPSLLETLGSRGVNHLLVEGGSATLTRFIEDGLWDEARIFRAPRSLGDGIPSPILPGILTSRQRIGSDWLDTFRPRDAGQNRPFST